MMDYTECDLLTKFGFDFQCKCISALISDRTFIERISDILDYKSFELDAHQFIVRETVNYFNEYKELPTLTVFKVKVNSIENPILKQSIIEQLKIVFQRISDNDLMYIKEQFLEFCKNQKVKNALYESVNYCKNGQYDKIRVLFDDALKAGMERNFGHDYLNDVDKRLSAMSREYIKTNWDVIDGVLDGGLAKGELGVIIGGAGVGKSWILVKLGVEAMQQGKNVLHITLELNENYVGLRYDACFNKINFQDVKKYRTTIQENVKNLKQRNSGILHVKYFPTKSISASSIKSLIDRMKMLGKRVDMLIVDYADILKPAISDGRGSSYNDAGCIYEELRAVAGECELPCWTGSQANRQSSESEIITGKDVADSFKKIMISDFIIGLSRKLTDKASNTARFHIIKNRFGPDGMTFLAKMNANCGDISLFDENSVEGIKILNESNEEEGMKQLLKSSWNNREKSE